MFSRQLALVIVGVLFTGCVSAGTQTLSQAQPSPTSVANEAVVPGSSDETWDRLVQRLSRGYYVINNIDKASRLINLSFSSNTPEEYVDCGTSTRTYTRGTDTRTFTNPTAQSSTYLTGEVKEHLIVTYEMFRQTSLEGRVNVYVAPKDGQSTSVAVNARYVLTVTVNGTYRTETRIGVKGPSGAVGLSQG